MTSMSRASIQSLLSDSARGPCWLEQMLQWAIELEYSTIPPYLCGLWSIVDPQGAGNSVASRLISVAMEEMVHAGMASNLLAAIGGKPHIAGSLPAYPARLPGGVRPGVILRLTGLSMTALHGMYMEVEYPEHGPLETFRGRLYHTIGEFYRAIDEEFQRLAPALQVDRQIKYRRSSVKIDPVETLCDVSRVIRTICEQGEGTSQSPNPSSGEEPAHYYRFGEIYHQREIIATASGWDYLGDPVPFPHVYPVVDVPCGGYDTQASLDFDAAYSGMLVALQRAWDDVDPDAIDEAADVMREMTVLGTALASTPLPEGGGNYCPSFRFNRET